MLRIVSVFFAAAIVSAAAYAQSAKPIDEKQCADQFKAIDLNNDGVLSGGEIASFKPNFPASLTKKNQVTRAEFMAVCWKKAS